MVITPEATLEELVNEVLKPKQTLLVIEKSAKGKGLINTFLNNVSMHPKLVVVINLTLNVVESRGESVKV